MVFIVFPIDVERVEVIVGIITKTASSPGWSKLGPYGNLKINICAANAKDESDCCRIPNLDNPGEVKDFELGAIDIFKGSALGKCNQFVIDGDRVQVSIENWHTSGYYPDGWGGEWIEIIFKSGKYVRCEVDAFVKESVIDITRSCRTLGIGIG